MNASTHFSHLSLRFIANHNIIQQEYPFGQTTSVVPVMPPPNLVQTPKPCWPWARLGVSALRLSKGFVKKVTSNSARANIISTPYFMLFVLCPGSTLCNTFKQSLTIPSLFFVIPAIPLYQHNMFSILTPYTLYPSIRITYPH